MACWVVPAIAVQLMFLATSGYCSVATRRFNVPLTTCYFVVSDKAVLQRAARPPMIFSDVDAAKTRV